MASRTENLGLIKPDLDDNIDVRQINNNSDVLDNEIYAVEQSVKKCVQKTGDTMSGALRTSSDIRKSTNNSVLTISGGDNTNNSATLDLCGGQRDDGVYAQLTVPTSDTDVKRTLQLHKDGNIYFNNVNRLVINSNDDYSINHNKQSIVFNDGIDIKTNTSAYVSVDGVGNVALTGNNLNSTNNELRIFTTNFDNSRISIDSTKTIIYGTNECGIVFDNSNFAFNPDGNLYINGNAIMKDVYARDDSTDSILIRMWTLNPFTVMLGIYVKNPNRAVDAVYVNFPVPFINTEYVVSSVGRNEDMWYACSEYRASVGGCTTTGMYVARDNKNGTDVFVIGRIK